MYLGSIFSLGQGKNSSAPPTIPTDYYLALDFNGNINDKSVNAHAMTGSSYSFETAPNGKQAIRFGKAIYISYVVSLGNVVTLSYKLFSPSVISDCIVAEFGNNFNNYNAFSSSIVGQKLGVGDHIPGSSNYNAYDYDGNVIGEKVVTIIFDRNQTLARNQVKVYINGVQIILTDVVVNAFSGNWQTLSLFIGGRGSGVAIYNGLMQNFRLYKRALSQEEITVLANE